MVVCDLANINIACTGATSATSIAPCRLTLAHFKYLWVLAHGVLTTSRQIAVPEV